MRKEKKESALCIEKEVSDIFFMRALHLHRYVSVMLFNITKLFPFTKSKISMLIFNNMFTNGNSVTY